MKKLLAVMLAGALLIPGMASAEKIKVRWFVGLGTGTNDQQIKPQEEVVKKFNESQDKIELTMEIVANAQAFDVLAMRQTSLGRWGFVDATVLKARGWICSRS